MNESTRLYGCVWLLIAGSFLATPAAAKRYVITDLGVLPGGTYSFATGINDRGETTGDGDSTAGLTRAWRYSHGTMTDLGSFTSDDGVAYAYAINNHGDVTGYSFTDESYAHAFVYRDEQLQDIGTLGGTDSGGYAINDTGQVTGSANTADDFTGPAFIYRKGVMRSLGSLGGSNGAGQGINDAGEITGWMYTAENLVQHAFLVRGGELSDLGTLGASGLNSQGYAINKSGDVVGESDTPAGGTHAFLYVNGSMKDLGTLGGQSSTALAINDAGVIVGDSYTANNAFHAFVYRKGRMTDLNLLLDPSSPLATRVTLNSAVGINHRGQIVANGSDVETNSNHAYLLTPRHCVEGRSLSGIGHQCDANSGGDECDNPCGEELGGENQPTGAATGR